MNNDIKKKEKTVIALFIAALFEAALLFMAYNAARGDQLVETTANFFWLFCQEVYYLNIGPLMVIAASLGLYGMTSKPATPFWRKKIWWWQRRNKILKGDRTTYLFLCLRIR